MRSPTAEWNSASVPAGNPTTTPCSACRYRDGVGAAGTDRVQHVGLATNDGDRPIVDHKMFTAWSSKTWNADSNDVISILRVVGQLTRQIRNHIDLADGQHRSSILTLQALARHVFPPDVPAQYQSEHAGGQSHCEIPSRNLELQKQLGDRNCPERPE